MSQNEYAVAMFKARNLIFVALADHLRILPILNEIGTNLLNELNNLDSEVIDLKLHKDRKTSMIDRYGNLFHDRQITAGIPRITPAYMRSIDYEESDLHDAAIEANRVAREADDEIISRPSRSNSDSDSDGYIQQLYAIPRFGS